MKTPSMIADRQITPWRARPAAGRQGWLAALLAELARIPEYQTQAERLHRQLRRAASVRHAHERVRS